MPRAAQTFRQTDVVRAIKAARAAGEDVARVEIGRDGRIVIVVAKSEAPATDPEIERWLADED